MSVPIRPQVVSLDETPTLIYEVYFKNQSSLQLYKLEVIDPSGKVIGTVKDEELNKSLRQPGLGISDYVVFIWLELEKQNIPSNISHKLYFKDTTGSEVIASGAKTIVDNNESLVIGPPFIGSKWYAANAPSNYNHHRIGIIEFMGKVIIPQRYAIDWMQLGPNGLLYKTDGLTNEDYYCYGADLIAVAEGIVVDTKDGIPENVPWEPVKVPEPQLGGNYVLIDIGESNYAFYAHMIPGSLKVKIGDKVKKGEVIGKLGNSGNSDAPHLHFHVSSSKEFLYSEGVPYMLDKYTFIDNVPKFSTVLNPETPWNGTSAQPIEYHQSAMPRDGDIVNLQ